MKRCLFALLTVVCAHLHAYEPYHATVVVSGVSANVSAPNLVNFNRNLSTDALEELIPIYTPTSAVDMGIDMRGLLGTISFASNSTTLVLTLPNAGIVQTFTGGTRDESMTLFKDYMKEGTSLRQLLKSYARFSPIDPIAGNPASLMAQMAQADYNLGMLTPYSGCDNACCVQPIKHLYNGELHVARKFCGKYDTTQVCFPLRYSATCLPWGALVVDAPLVYQRNGGASSMAGSLGVAAKIPVNTSWSLTPIARFGFGGSLDLCTAGTFLSTGLTSLYSWHLGGYALSMINYAGYYTSTSFWLTGVNFDYHLSCGVYKNGFNLTSCEGHCFGGRRYHFVVGLEDTYFSGGKLYIRHYDEVSIGLTTKHIRPCMVYDAVSMSFAYQWGEHDFKGYELRCAYQF